MANHGTERERKKKRDVGSHEILPRAAVVGPEKVSLLGNVDCWPFFVLGHFLCTLENILSSLEGALLVWNYLKLRIFICSYLKTSKF